MKPHPVGITTFGRKIKFRVGLNLPYYYFGRGVMDVEAGVSSNTPQVLGPMA